LYDNPSTYNRQRRQEHDPNPWHHQAEHPPRKAEDLVAILPPGIDLLHDQLNIHDGSEQELRDAMGLYDAKIAAMAGQGAELIHPAGAPPLLLGYRGEQQRIREWEELAGVPVFTNGSSQVNALRAFGARQGARVLLLPGRREPQVRPTTWRKRDSKCSA
jgi:hypothetical protein